MAEEGTSNRWKAPSDHRSYEQYEECMMSPREIPFLLNTDRAKSGALVKRAAYDGRVTAAWFILIAPTYIVTDGYSARRARYKWFAFNAETGVRCKISLRDRLYEVKP